MRRLQILSAAKNFALFLGMEIFALTLVLEQPARGLIGLGPIALKPKFSFKTN